MKSMLAVMLMVCGVGACNGGPTPPPTTTSSPPPQPDTLQAPASASLIRRVAEAADGLRDGRDWWVVVDRTFPHPLLGAFPSDSAARDSIAKAPGNWEVFGPFRTTEDQPYTGDASEDVIKVIVVTSKGQKEFDGKRYDAIFWGLTGFDKFVAPYLTEVAGVTYAAEERERYRTGQSRLANSMAIGHYRTSF